MPHRAWLDLTCGASGEGIVAGIETLVIAGWTGRDTEAMEAHVQELETLGVARPKTMPIFYRVAASLLTTADEIQVSGTASSGEVETVLFEVDGARWVGVGSDHTDREAEKFNVSISKQACAKPVAQAVWRFDEVADHWDDLVLRSWAWDNDKRVLYQEGPAARMRAPEDLVARYGALPDGSAMFCGTLAVEDEIRPAEEFEIELEDPVLDRRISHRYAVTALPVEG